MRAASGLFAMAGSQTWLIMNGASGNGSIILACYSIVIIMLVVSPAVQALTFSGPARDRDRLPSLEAALLSRNGRPKTDNEDNNRSHCWRQCDCKQSAATIGSPDLPWQNLGLLADCAGSGFCCAKPLVTRRASPNHVMHPSHDREHGSGADRASTLEKNGFPHPMIRSLLRCIQFACPRRKCPLDLSALTTRRSSHNTFGLEFGGSGRI